MGKVIKHLFYSIVFCSCFMPILAFSNQLVGIKIVPLPNERARLVFEFEKSVTKKPASFLMKAPARLVFDFLNMKDGLPSDDRAKKLHLGVINGYTVLSTSNRLRVVLNLEQTVSYATERLGKTFAITFAATQKKLRYAKNQSIVNKQDVSNRNQVTAVDFRGAGKNSGKLVIRLDGGQIDTEVKEENNKVKINFLDTSVPQKLIRRLDVSDFHTPAKMVDVYQLGKKAQFVINTKGNYGQFAYQINKEFFVDIFPLTDEQMKEAKLKKKIYTGKRISLNFQSVNIKQVLQILADFNNKNLVVSDKVTGDISLRLEDVPWDQALHIILKTQGLGMRDTGDVLLVDTRDAIIKQDKQALEEEKQSQELAPLHSELMQINYARAADVAELLKSKGGSGVDNLLSDRGSVRVDKRTNTIWIQDTSHQLERVQDLVKKLDIPVKQVLIEARVVVVNKDFEKDLGVRFGVSRPTHLSGTIAGASQLAQGTPASDVLDWQNTDSFIPTDRLNLDLPAPVTTGTPASIGLALAKLGGGVLLDLELSALESEGKGEVISTPRLITANQQTATIESGDEIPYQEATSSGATSVSFKKAVLSLKVTPQITPDDKIILDLGVNQDAPKFFPNTTVPGISTKQIQTNVLVDNGQTIVLGGIYKQTKTKTVTRIPFLGKLPLIGALFRNKKNITEHEELLIFITPKIIRHAFMTT